MRQATIKSSIRRFISAWDNGVENRLNAAKIYAEAVNTWDLSAKQAFHDLAAFRNWSPFQWRLLYQIGSNRISPLYLDFARPSLPLAMLRRGLSLAEQADIFNNGLQIADLTGRVRVIKLRQIQDKNLSQVYDTNGIKRSILQQIKWLQEHQHGNLEVLPDGQVRVHHACYITPEMLAKIIAAPAVRAALARVVG